MKLSEVVRVRLTSEELARVKQSAERNHRSVSNEIRAALLDSPARRDGEEVMAGLDRALRSDVASAPRGRAELVGGRVDG